MKKGNCRGNEQAAQARKTADRLGCEAWNKRGRDRWSIQSVKRMLKVPLFVCEAKLEFFSLVDFSSRVALTVLAEENGRPGIEAHAVARRSIMQSPLPYLVSGRA